MCVGDCIEHHFLLTLSWHLFFFFFFFGCPPINRCSCYTRRFSFTRRKRGQGVFVSSPCVFSNVTNDSRGASCFFHLPFCSICLAARKRRRFSRPPLAVWFLMRCTLLLSIAFPSRPTTTTKWKMIFHIKKKGSFKISVSSPQKWPPMKLAVNCKKKHTLAVKNWYFISSICVWETTRRKWKFSRRGWAPFLWRKEENPRAPATTLCSYLQPLFSHIKRRNSLPFNIF